MEKFYTVGTKPVSYKTYAEAEVAAKRSLGKLALAYGHANGDVYIFEAQAVVKSPVPEAEVTKLN